MRVLAAIFLAFCVLAPAAHAQTSEAATRKAWLDKDGTIRWRDDNSEVALFGANYCLMSGGDYRMAGLVGADRKTMIDEDMAQFARMGWTGLRLCSWGDWENSDKDGNLVVNDHVDLLDYLIAKARERGIYILLTPIHGYSPAFPDRMNKPEENVGFSRWFEKKAFGTDAKSIAAQANYIGQLLRHVNPYTGTALKDESALLFVEVINEPIHHPEDLAGSVSYIDALVKSVRDTGTDKVTFFNVSQDFRIAEAIRQSTVDGASFGWYPSGLVAGRTLKGNFLQAVDSYPDMLRPELKGRPRIVYEFDSADMNTGYMYPAMVRAYRAGGIQFASMFAYDQLETAPYNLGWQTHFLNLVHSPRKAIGAVIAAEAMRRLPRFRSYGRYPDNRAFGDFRVDYEHDLSELNAPDAFMNAGATDTMPRDPARLTRIAGFESSPLVGYEGSGAYFLDKVRDGVWRLEVYPDEVLVRDPFEQPRPDKVVSRLLHRAWPMRVTLPDLGDAFHAAPINVRHGEAAQAQQGRFVVEPGVWLLSKEASVGNLPKRINRVGFDEFHVNAPVSYPDEVLSLAPKQFAAGAPIALTARVADNVLPDGVKLWVRPVGARGFAKPIAMTRSHGNDYTVDAGRLAPGLYEYAISETKAGRAMTFPAAVAGEPGEWPFFAEKFWSFRVVAPDAPVRLLDPKNDVSSLSFVRPHENVRGGLYSIVPGRDAGEFALAFGVPDLGSDTPELYAAQIDVDPILTRAATLEITLRSTGAAATRSEVSLIEKDGSAWKASIVAGKNWRTVAIPLAALKASRSVLIPSPFPGLWDYWREMPAHRGGKGDRVHIADVERLQLVALRGGPGIAVQSVSLK
ncbi:MAG TPA: hypothetical protein VG889_08745 [Rhizomicrobium sp.]|nr:hypothetical protein [Rhizomicrobium sp.]